MKKRYLIVVILILSIFSFIYVNGLDEVQLTVCQSADTNNNCNQLENLGAVTKEECCSELNLCCISNSISKTEFKNTLINALKDYLKNPNNAKLNKNELKDLIVVYFKSTGSTISLSGVGDYSKENIIDIYNKAKGINDQCTNKADGSSCTNGKCSSGQCITSTMPSNVSSLSQVCANKFDIPNREKDLGVVNAYPFARVYSDRWYYLGVKDMAFEPGTYAYIKFDYNPWNKVLKQFWDVSNADSAYNSCAYNAREQFNRPRWEGQCKLDASGKPIMKPKSELTTNQFMDRMTDSWGGWHSIEKLCSKTWQEEVTEKKAACESCRNGVAVSGVDSCWGMNHNNWNNWNNIWTQWAESNSSAERIQFYFGNIDRVAGASAHPIYRGESWLAYECLPAPQELKREGFVSSGSFVKFINQFNFPGSDSGAVSLEEKNARPGRYYLIIRIDDGQFIDASGKIHTAVASDVNPYEGLFNY